MAGNGMPDAANRFCKGDGFQAAITDRRKSYRGPHNSCQTRQVATDYIGLLLTFSFPSWLDRHHLPSHASLCYCVQEA